MAINYGYWRDRKLLKLDRWLDRNVRLFKILYKKNSIAKNIDSMAQTCWISPSQWEIKLKDGRMVYCRYRYSILTVSISPKITNNILDAVNGLSVLEETVSDKGNRHGGAKLRRYELIRFLNKTKLPELKV